MLDIRQGDCREVMAAMEPASVDAIVTDPPYGERNAHWDAPRDFAWHEEWLLQAARVLKPGAPLVTFASRRYLDLVMGAMRRVLGDGPGRPLQTAVWVHRQGHTSRAGFLRPEHEPIIVSGALRTTATDVRSQRTYRTPHSVARKQTHRRAAARGFNPITYTPHEDGPMAGTVFECARSKGADEGVWGHPTQKPEAVMEYWLCLAAAPGDLVLDPFAGSGTVGVVALRHGRRFVGIELNPEYVEMARRRIGGPLFAEQTPPAPTAARINGATE